MNRKDRYPLGKKIKYLLDDFFSKGFWAQTLLLAGAAIVLTLLFGVVAMKFGEENFVEGYWTSLMHMIDQGTITGDEKGTDAYFVFMLFVTFIGMAFTSTIIAIISSAIQDKLDELKKGHSGIIEKEHVVILGFDDNACTICREIAEGSRLSEERICVVVADDLPKDEMEHSLHECRAGQRHYEEKSSALPMRDKRIKILFRSGDPVSENTLSICSVKNARAVVVNRESDSETIRILLALASYLKKNNAYLDNEKMPAIVADIHDFENISAAMAAAEIGFEADGELNRYKIQIMHDGKILDRLFAQTCVQPGLPYVMDALFNYRGSSIRVEGDGEESPFIGKTLSEISGMVTDLIPIGFLNNTAVRLNPADNIMYKQGDRLVYLSEKKSLTIGETSPAEAIGTPAREAKKSDRTVRSFLFFGCSGLSGMLNDVSEYCAEGSDVSCIASETVMTDETEMQGFHFRTIHCEQPYRWSDAKRIFEDNGFWFDKNDERHLTNIVILSPKNIDMASADENVMLLLLNIRQYLKERDMTDICITTEMCLPQNQLLMQSNSSSDYVAASGITHRMIAQITDDARKHCIIDELLCRGGAAIELRPISDFADVSREFNFAYIFKSALSDETLIPLGWLRESRDGVNTDNEGSERVKLVLNPTREELETRYDGGSHDDCRLVVLRGKSN